MLRHAARFLIGLHGTALIALASVPVIAVVAAFTRGIAAGSIVLALLLGVAGSIAYRWRRARWLLLAATLVKLRQFRRRPVGQRPCPELESSTTIRFDRRGIPTIEAGSRADALRALGFVCAEDRLFQMDLLRRGAAGRLAEVLGPSMLGRDEHARRLGFARLAPAILAAMPEHQRRELVCFSEGVNAYCRSHPARRFEFFVLDYHPEPWSPEDSLLVLLRLWETQCGDDSTAWMLAVMRAALPPEMVRFLTPEHDEHDVPILGRPRREPASDLLQASELLAAASVEARVDIPCSPSPRPGSNCWAVAGSRTADGRAILANDMHMELSAPNLFYLAELRYPGQRVAGVVVPGLPIILAGSNGHVAWGLTNMYADCLELVALDIDPSDPSRYRVSGCWRSFDRVPETIRVRNRPSVSITVQTTEWGPIQERTLAGRSVALHWTALDPAAVDTGFGALGEARTLEDAVSIAASSKGPPMNVILADRHGRIAWTASGTFPARTADGTPWVQYLGADELPRVVDPPGGAVVSANHRPTRGVGPDLGSNFAPGYRAHRIHERLAARHGLTEDDMRAIQLDTRVAPLDAYHRWAIEALGEPANDDARAMLAELTAWDGRASASARGFFLVAGLHELLTRRLLAPALAPCLAIDPEFRYAWFNSDAVVNRLLREKPQAWLLALGEETWPGLIRSCLFEVWSRVRPRFRDSRIRWGELNPLQLGHPLSVALPALRALLVHEPAPQHGCPTSVRVGSPTFGATTRMVVAPGREADALFHMPTGQSEHPVRRTYCDQQRAWLDGAKTPMHSIIEGPAIELVPGPHD